MIGSKEVSGFDTGGRGGEKNRTRSGTNGNAANYELRVGMHTITLRPQQASQRALGPIFCKLRGLDDKWMVPKFR
jgi:hypothetical protein